MTFYESCSNCTKWRTALCHGVQQDPDETWNGKDGSCSGHRSEPLPPHPTCDNCGIDICGRFENEKRHGGTWDTMSHNACQMWIEKIPAKTKCGQTNLEAFL